MKKIVLAYSGGLDTSVAITWLKETYGAEIIAFCADIGQEEELDGLDEKAYKTGASTAYIEDLREEFTRDFVFPMLRGAAVYEGRYLLKPRGCWFCIVQLRLFFAILFSGLILNASWQAALALLHCLSSL